MCPHRTTVLVSDSSGHGPFLTADELLSAIQGHLDTDAKLVIWTRQLGCLYHEWVTDPDTGEHLRGRIGDTIAAIDAWIYGQLPRPIPGVPRGTDSCGGVIARVAEAWACAYWTLHHGHDELQRHRAWHHLAEMAEGYTDFIRLVLDGLIILPTSWPGIGWPGLATTKPTPQQATTNTGNGTRPK